MLFKATNLSLIQDVQKTYLTTASAVADTTLNVKDIAGFGIGDYIIIGEIGEEGTEIKRIHASTAPSVTTITLVTGGVTNAHGVDTPVYRADYNKAYFYRATTLTGTKTLFGSGVDIDPSEYYTYYEDTSNSTGYGFIRWYNSTDDTASSYSGGVNYEHDAGYSSYDPRTLFRITKGVRKLLGIDREDSEVSDDQIRNTVNDKQRDVSHQELWSFYEVERSFSAVANQFAFNIPSTVQKIHSVNFLTRPLAPINYQRWKNLHWDSDTTSTEISRFCIWNNQILLYPRPSTAANADAIDDVTDITATDTTITVDDSSDFKRGDYFRFIIDDEVIYATNSTSTTFTGCLRGREGTTAILHLDDAVITERDIVYSAHVEPTDLFLGSDRTAVPEPYVLEIGSAADLAYGILKDNELGDRLTLLYDKEVKKLKSKYAMKDSGQFSRVKDRTEIVSDKATFSNLNDYPKSVNT